MTKLYEMFIEQFPNKIDFIHNFNAIIGCDYDEVVDMANEIYSEVN
jgi:hypothetical protein